jgi:hypothetical protein
MSPNPFVEALNVHTVREEAKLGAIHDRLLEIVAIQSEQKAILAEHIRRSNANEDLIRDLRAATEARLRPLEDSTVSWASAGKLSAILASTAGVVYAILKAMGLV